MTLTKESSGNSLFLSPIFAYVWFANFTAHDTLRELRE